MQSVHFKFGKARVPDDPKPMRFLRKWMDEHCRDWRLLEEGDQVAADFVLRKPMPAKKFRSLLAHHVKNWGFQREAYARDNCKPMSIDDYLKGPDHDESRMRLIKRRVWILLQSVYYEAEGRARPILEERAKARRERAKARRERAKARKEARRAKKAQAKAHRRIRKRFLRA